MTIECVGNGVRFSIPPARGNQWTLGAVACSEWTGVRLADVLKAAGVKDNVVYTAHVGADTHLSGKEGKLAISRGVPVEKAMNPNNLIAFGMNGGLLHPMNGAPLRLVIPGWPGSCSQKWLKRVWLRDVVHDGPKMTGSAYRVSRLFSGFRRGRRSCERAAYDINHLTTHMPVKSLIYDNRGTGFHEASPNLSVAGSPWAGDNVVARVDVSIDFGASRGGQRRSRGTPLTHGLAAGGPRNCNSRKRGITRSGRANDDTRSKPTVCHRVEPEGLSQQRDAQDFGAR